MLKIGMLHRKPAAVPDAAFVYGRPSSHRTMEEIRRCGQAPPSVSALIAALRFRALTPFDSHSLSLNTCHTCTLQEGCELRHRETAARRLCRRMDPEEGTQAEAGACKECACTAHSGVPWASLGCSGDTTEDPGTKPETPTVVQNAQVSKRALQNQHHPVTYFVPAP